MNSLRIVVVLSLADINKGDEGFVGLLPTLAEGVNALQSAMLRGPTEDLAVVDGLSKSRVRSARRKFGESS